MTEFTFKPAASFTERAGLFVSLVGGTNSGKTYSALRLARGIAGPKGKIAVIDTEGGRTLHLKEQFAFDAAMFDPPFLPARFAQGAKDAEEAGYDALLIDSFSMEWVGLGGVLDWQAAEFKRLGGKDSIKALSWSAPKQAHKAMVYGLLQRRIPIVFSIRGEETFVPPSTKIFKAITNKAFPFEVTVSFRLSSERKGAIDLSDPSAWKMEGAHREIFRHGEIISEEHGAQLSAWARGAPIARKPVPTEQMRDEEAAPDDRNASFGRSPRRDRSALQDEARAKAKLGYDPFNDWWRGLTKGDQQAVGEIEPEIRTIITEAERVAA